MRSRYLPRCLEAVERLAEHRGYLALEPVHEEALEVLLADADRDQITARREVHQSDLSGIGPLMLEAQQRAPDDHR